ncbi:hypothetical protein F4818DRAFT_88439 [Hypoxylon cercidicola]|nr:hypothetical protein F4818DRAFT_88439 [Hypoxylon cercidicola]
MANANTQHGHNGGIVRGLAASRHRNGGSVSLPPTPQASIAPSPPKQNHSQIPLPQHFLVRPNITKYTASGTVTTPGPIVPLVAVDQLPEGLDLLGVPRELSVEQTVGLTNLGTVVREPEFYQVYTHNGNGVQQQQQQEHKQEKQITETVDVTRRLMSLAAMKAAPTTPSHTRSSISSSSSSSSMITQSPLVFDMSPAGAIFPPGGTINNSNSNNNNVPPINAYQEAMQQYLQLQSQIHSQSPPPPAPAPARHPPPPPAPPSNAHPGDRMLRSWLPPAPPGQGYKPGSASNPGNRAAGDGSSTTTTNTNSRKGRKPCRHWCLHGTCRWGSDCRHPHMMPTDAEGLRELGLASPPQWWLTAVAMAWGSNGGSLARGGPRQQSGGGGGGSAGGARKGQGQGQRGAVGKGKGPVSPDPRNVGPPSDGNRAAMLHAAPPHQEGVGGQLMASGEQRRHAEQVALSAPALAPASALTPAPALAPALAPTRTPAPAPVPAAQEQVLVEL